MKMVMKRVLKSAGVFFFSAMAITAIMCCITYTVLGDLELYKELLHEVLTNTNQDVVGNILKVILIYATFITALYYCFGSENSNEIKKIGRYIKKFVLWEIIFVVLFVLSTPVRVIHYSVILPLLAIICTYLIKKYKNVSL